MRALVTGATGFVGQALSLALIDAKYDVTGLTPEDPSSAAQLSSAALAQIDWVRGDIRRTEDIRRALDVAPPDAIFHSAGVSSVPGAAGDPGAAAEVNVVGVARLLAEVRVRKRVGVLDPAVLVVGSAEQYGRHEKADLPLDEEAEQRPLTVYAATKAAQEVVALEAFRSEGVRVIAVRSFNHSGAGQAQSFLIPSLVARALALKGSSDRNARLAIGNGASIRDFLHVEDVVAAYMALAVRGHPGDVYNVCSGVGVSVKDLAVQVLSATGVKAPLAPDPSLVRAIDVPALIGDNTKLRDATGWEPTRSVRDIIDDLVRAATRSADRPSRSPHASTH